MNRCERMSEKGLLALMEGMKDLNLVREMNLDFEG